MLKAVFSTALVSTLYVATWLSGYSVAVNPSESMEPGLYVVRNRVDVNDLKKGDVVSACIPENDDSKVFLDRKYLPHSDRCPSGLAPVIKPVAALSGDLVSVTESGVSINGVYQARSKVFDTDSNGIGINHLPVGWSKVLAPGEFFLLANRVDRSLDSRYYGLVRTRDLTGKSPFKLF